MKPLFPNPNRTLARRSFLKTSLAASVAVPLVRSLEEHALAHGAAPDKAATDATPGPVMPTGTIGNVKISRLICGGNLISGYAHSRDLIYLSSFLKQYFTDEKIMETWALCEQRGVNTMICYPEDKHAIDVYQK